MRRPRLTSYLRTERLRSGLSQRELGELLGVSRSAVGKAESGRSLAFEYVLTAGIVFDRGPRDLIPAVYEALEYEILLRAVALDARLSAYDDPVTRKKRGLLGALINRLQFNQPWL